MDDFLYYVLSTEIHTLKCMRKYIIKRETTRLLSYSSYKYNVLSHENQKKTKLIPREKWRKFFIRVELDQLKTNKINCHDSRYIWCRGEKGRGPPIPTIFCKIIAKLLFHTVPQWSRPRRHSGLGSPWYAAKKTFCSKYEHIHQWKSDHYSLRSVGWSWNGVREKYCWVGWSLRLEWCEKKILLRWWLPNGVAVPIYLLWY